MTTGSAWVTTARAERATSPDLGRCPPRVDSGTLCRAKALDTNGRLGATNQVERERDDVVEIGIPAVYPPCFELGCVRTASDLLEGLCMEREAPVPEQRLAFAQRLRGAEEASCRFCIAFQGCGGEEALEGEGDALLRPDVGGDAQLLAKPILRLPEVAGLHIYPAQVVMGNALKKQVVDLAATNYDFLEPSACSGEVAAKEGEEPERRARTMF